MIALRWGLTATLIPATWYVGEDEDDSRYRSFCRIELAGVDEEDRPVALSFRAAEIDALVELLPPRKEVQ